MSANCKSLRRTTTVVMSMRLPRTHYFVFSGYELFIPTEHALQVYDRIWEVGKGMGLKSAGLRALGSLRMVGDRFVSTEFGVKPDV